jgi:hypothetical protein
MKTEIIASINNNATPKPTTIVNNVLFVIGL